MVNRRYKSWSDDVDGPTEPSYSHEQPIVSHSHSRQLFLIWQPILLYHSEIIKIIPNLLLLEYVE